MMKLMLRLMKMLPKWISDKMNPPIVAKHRLERWRSNPACIAMNLTNLLICSDYCIPCPSHPGKRGDGVYCATGKSDFPIEKKGCYCFSCPLFKQCGRESKAAYFCIYGACPDKA